MTSVGLRDLDSILGGGQPLGTCLLLEEDRWTRDLSLCLIKYWCAEVSVRSKEQFMCYNKMIDVISFSRSMLLQAISHGQTLIVPAFEDDNLCDNLSDPPSFNEKVGDVAPSSGATKALIQDLLDNLPRNLHWDKEAGQIQQLQQSIGAPLEILEEDEEEGNAEEGLEIAWQYRKSVQDERLGLSSPLTMLQTGSDTYCHSFDLSSGMKEQREDLIRSVHVEQIVCCNGNCEGSRVCGMNLFRQLCSMVNAKLAACKRSVVRLLLLQINPVTTSIALPLLLAYIRQHQLPVVILVTVQAWTCSSAAAHITLRRVSDVVMQTEGFASRVAYPPPPEFRHLVGLLHLFKVSTVTAATANGGGHFADLTLSKRAAAQVYGLKRDRRKLHVPLLHIPPEDYSGGGSVSGGAVRSGAGKPKEAKLATSGCSSGDGGNSSIDF